MTTPSFDALLFNTHDLILVMAAAQYLLLAVLLETTRRRSDLSSHLLAIILLLNVCKALDTLLIWSDSLRALVLAWQPDILLLGGLAYWLEGPLLYWYVSAVLYRDFRFRAMQLLHLVPLLLVTLVLFWHYQLRPADEQIALMAELEFIWGPVMERLISLRNLSIILYGSWCLWELHRYRRLLRDNYANIEARERRWLVWFCGGFVLIATWTLSVHFVGDGLAYEVANLLGIGTNYATFFFVNSLVFISIRYTHLFDGIDESPPSDDAGQGVQPIFKEEQITRVINLMENEKPFLNADINLEILAKRLSLPERTLSRILNKHFGKNFFEFINHYRVEEAKSLLADPSRKHLSMLDILAEAGFSSKSTFNAIFKQHQGQTPSQYRKTVEAPRGD